MCIRDNYTNVYFRLQVPFASPPTRRYLPTNNNFPWPQQRKSQDCAERHVSSPLSPYRVSLNLSEGRAQDLQVKYKNMYRKDSGPHLASSIPNPSCARGVLSRPLGRVGFLLFLLLLLSLSVFSPQRIPAVSWVLLQALRKKCWSKPALFGYHLQKELHHVALLRAR